MPKNEKVQPMPRKYEIVRAQFFPADLKAKLANESDYRKRGDFPNALLAVKDEILTKQAELNYPPPGYCFILPNQSLVYLVTGFDSESSAKPWAIYVDIQPLGREYS